MGGGGRRSSKNNQGFARRWPAIWKRFHDHENTIRITAVKHRREAYR